MDFQINFANLPQKIFLKKVTSNNTFLKGPETNLQIEIILNQWTHALQIKKSANLLITLYITEIITSLRNKFY